MLTLSAIPLGTGLTVQQVSAGTDFTCVLLSDNTLKCFGRNNVGQLGQGHTNDIGDQPFEMGDNLTVTLFSG